MTTLLAFIALSHEEKSACLLAGELVATREENDQYLFLYKLRNYYAELSFDRRTGQITDIIGFRARSRLRYYSVVRE